MNKFLKISTICYAIVFPLFIVAMLVWDVTYDKYLHNPDIEAILDITIPQHQIIKSNHYQDVEIGPDFGDCTYIDIKIENDTLIYDFTNQISNKGWTLIDNGEYGKYYHYETEIPDHIAQLGNYGGNWYPDEGEFHYFASVVTSTPIGIFFYGIFAGLIVGIILIIAWVSFKIYQKSNCDK